MPHEESKDVGKRNLFAEKNTVATKFADREDEITQVIGQFKGEYE